MSRSGSRGDPKGEMDISSTNSRPSSKQGGSRPGNRGDALESRPVSRDSREGSRQGKREASNLGPAPVEPISLKAFLDSRPVSPETKEKQAALTKEFLQSLDQFLERLVAKLGPTREPKASQN